MSDYYTPPSTTPWNSDSPDFDEDTPKDEMKILVVGLGHYRTYYPEPYWAKMYLPFLYEDIRALNRSCDDDTLKQVHERSTTIIRTPMYSGDGKKTLLHTFEWKVLNVGPNGGLVVQAELAYCINALMTVMCSSWERNTTIG